MAGHMPDSPPSYEEAMRLSPEGCSVTVRLFSVVVYSLIHYYPLCRAISMHLRFCFIHILFKFYYVIVFIYKMTLLQGINIVWSCVIPLFQEV